MTTLEQKISDLEARLETAEGTIAKLSKLVRDGVLSTVTTPFRVVDQDGRVLMEVSSSNKGTEGRMRLFNKEGAVVASLGTDVEGGNLVIRNNAGKIVSYLNVGPDGARFALDASNNLAGIAFYTTETGSGLVISDTNGKGGAELYTDEQSGTLVLREDNIPIVVLPPD